MPRLLYHLKKANKLDKFLNKYLGKFKLRTVLIVPFILQISTAVGLVGYLSFKNGEKAVNNLAIQLHQEIAFRIEQHLDAYLASPYLIHQINLDALSLKQLNLNNLTGLEKHLWQQMQQFPKLGFIGYATEKRELVGIERLDDSSLEINFMDNSSPHNLRIYTTDDQGNRVKLRKIIPNFINRQRPWYQKAVQAKKATWSDIFIYQGTPRPAISSVVPVYEPTGNLQGVLFNDLLLSLITNFLKSLNISKSGETFIIERSGMLIATSREKPFIIEDKQGVKRLKAIETEDILIRETAQKLLTKFGSFTAITNKQQLKLNINHQPSLVQVSPFQDKYGLDWLIVVILPESDFMAQINANTRGTIGLCFIAIVIATIISIITVQWVTKPILTLNKAAKNLSQGKWDQSLENNRNDEIGELTTSFNSMATQLKEAFATLEERVTQRTAELVEAKEKAEVANQAKSTFIANMSHELRSPLNAILGFSQLMTRSTDLSPENQENISIINRSGEYLLSLINNILDLSKIEAGKITLNPKHFDLYRFLDDLEDIFHLRAENKGLQLIFERAESVPRYVCTDEVKLRQVLINLLNNALKFTHAGGVSVRVGYLDKPIIQLEIEDTGEGIAPEEVGHIFEAFVQTKAGKESQEGTGLGLAIAHQFIQLMGGEIKVNSQLGKGTIFKFDIPIQFSDISQVEIAENKPQVIGVAANQPAYKILVVDDKITNRQLLIKLLQPLGFELKEAQNGQEAVEIWNLWEPHLIWMDMRMPVMDGYEATQIIKATIKGQATAVIALTASVLEEEKAIILSAGCDDFLRKPFQEAAIFETMAKHLGVRYLYKDNNQLSHLSNQEKVAKLTAESLTVMSLEWIVQLDQASLEADADLVFQLIQQIPKSHQFLAESLTNLVNKFQFEKILELTELIVDEQ